MLAPLLSTSESRVEIRACAMLAAVSACTAFMGPAPIVSRRHMSRIVMDEATRDPEPAVGKAVYDANAGWCESHCWLP